MYDPDNEGYYGVQTENALTMTNFVVRASTFEGFPPGHFPLDLRYVTLSGLQIIGNTFTRNNSGSGNTLIYIAPYGAGAPSIISHNVFDNVVYSTSYAVYMALSPAVPATGQSNFRITDNFFNGFTAQSLFIYNAGTTPVERNTFGTSSYGGATVANETDTGASFINYAGTTSNNTIRPWFPTSATIDTVDCQLDVAVTPPTAGNIPAAPGLRSTRALFPSPVQTSADLVRR
jgi:adhesin/invasin